MKLNQEEIDERVEKAKDLFYKGYNCAQSVFGACADLQGISDQELALRLASSFGGGIGRMRQTCGAACGMFLLEGLHSGSSKEGDSAGKMHNYERVQALAEQFKKENGSLICAELLGMASQQVSTNPMPEQRTEAYYKKRPCSEMVASATHIFLESLIKEE